MHDRTATVTLPADDQILITRTFAAPPRLVWRAWTEPALVRRWWHADRGSMTACEIDLRVGGRWRYAMEHAGTEVAFSGEYREVVPHQRLVSTEVYESWPDAVAVNTLTLTPDGDGCRMEILVEHGSPAARDAHLAAGMEDGLQDALGLLDDVSWSLAASPSSPSAG